MELLTTDEAAQYLRLSERKLYELVANGEIPCTKITGRWLFPRAALDRWVLGGLIAPRLAALEPPPPSIVGGSHDPLLEWSLRESQSGLASLNEGSETGLQRLAAREVVAAGIHLHQLDNDDEETNPQAVARTPGLHDPVVIAFVRRQQGIIVAAGNPLGITDLPSVAAKSARLAQRQPGAGAQLLLVALLARAKIDRAALKLAAAQFATSSDTADAMTAGLDFVPLVWERFDLVFRMRDYFRPGPQSLLRFMNGPRFREHADQLSGYDVSVAGEVRLAPAP